MGTNTPASKSQIRAMALFGITMSSDSYVRAAEALAAAGIEKDGVPFGHDWRSAKRLSDSDLRAALLAPLDVTETVPDHD